ncbi:hypothetical protein DSUL_20545 [Desulfovibrionales bacterium]
MLGEDCGHEYGFYGDTHKKSSHFKGLYYSDVSVDKLKFYYKLNTA